MTQTFDTCDVFAIDDHEREADMRIRVDGDDVALLAINLSPPLPAEGPWHRSEFQDAALGGFLMRIGQRGRDQLRDLAQAEAEFYANYRGPGDSGW